MSTASMHAFGPSDDYDGPRSYRLLKLGLTQPRRPIDELIERLSRDDGATWFLGLCQRQPLNLFGLANEALPGGRASVAQLTELKETGKRMLRESGTDSRLIGMATYFLAVAAALANHGALICSRTREELDPVLLDLATVLPGQWSEMLGRATMRK
jgi:hypothetical protein